MKNTFKKFLAVLLSVLTCFSCGVTAFAEGENAPAEKPESEFTCYGYQLSDYYSTDFIVVTFDGKYSRIGEIPEVCIDFDRNGKQTLTEDLITLKVFEHEGKRYPQLFIKASCVDVSCIEIGEGAFVTESGELSSRLEIPSNKITKAYDLGVLCKLDMFEVEENIDLITGKTARYATVGKPVSIVADSEFGKVWLDEITATYTVNGETAEITSDEFVPQKPGSYVVEIKFGNITAGKWELEVLSETNSYTKSLFDATEWMLLTPLYFVLGTGLFVLIPGFGTWIGSTTVMAAAAMIPKFFMVLFSGPIYSEYILE